MPPRRPGLGLAGAAGQSSPRPSLPTQDLPALPVIENPDVETRTLPFAPPSFPSPMARGLGWLVAQRNTQRGAAHLIFGQVCRRTARSPG